MKRRVFEWLPPVSQLPDELINYGYENHFHQSKERSHRHLCHSVAVFYGASAVAGVVNYIIANTVRMSQKQLLP